MTPGGVDGMRIRETGGTKSGSRSTTDVNVESCGSVEVTDGGGVVSHRHSKRVLGEKKEERITVRRKRGDHLVTVTVLEGKGGKHFCRFRRERKVKEKLGQKETQRGNDVNG